LADASSLYSNFSRAYRLVYGQNDSQLAFTPCPSATSATGCGAVALSSTGQDLTPQISLYPVDLCSSSLPASLEPLAAAATARNGGTCPATCSPGAIQFGFCVTGLYALQVR
jgi:hypothetical protein